MKKFLVKHSHGLFKAGVLIKLGIAIVEIIAGFAFYFLSYEAMRTLATSFLQMIIKNPDSSVLNLVNSGFRDLVVYSTSFWVFIFLSHGVTKILLTQGLLRNKAWAYVTSLLVFSYFIVNQIYQAIRNPSIVLLLITVFDGIVVFLIFYEYRHRIVYHEGAVENG